MAEAYERKKQEVLECLIDLTSGSESLPSDT
jgi:hypothetical protein